MVVSSNRIPPAKESAQIINNRRMKRTRINIKLGVGPSPKLIVIGNISLDDFLFHLLRQVLQEFVDSFNGYFDRSSFVLLVVKNCRVGLAVRRKTFVRSLNVLDVEAVDQPPRSRDFSSRLAPRKSVVGVNTSNSRVIGLGKNVTEVDGSVGTGGSRIVVEGEARVDGNDSHGAGIAVLLSVALVRKSLVKMVERVRPYC